MYVDPLCVVRSTSNQDHGNVSEVGCMCVLVHFTRPGGGRRRGRPCHYELWCLTESHRRVWHVCQSSNLHYQIRTWAYLSFSPRAHGVAGNNTATTPQLRRQEAWGKISVDLHYDTKSTLKRAKGPVTSNTSQYRACTECSSRCLASRTWESRRAPSLRGRSAVPTIAKLSAFRTETLFGGWPASLGDMVRFLAQAGPSCDARTWEQTLFFVPSAWHPSPGRPPPCLPSPLASLPRWLGEDGERSEHTSGQTAHRPPPPLAAHAPRQ